MSRIAVRVSADAARHVRAGHPWVFEGSITDQSRPGEPGELAVVFDDRRRFAGIGLYDPDSPIRVKVLHHGDPLPLDEAFLAGRICEAVDRRRPLLDAGDTTGYRLVHGENDALPGLVVDRYAGVSVVKLYTRAWLPHLPAVVDALQARLPAEAVILRYARAVRPGPGDGAPAEATALVGTAPTQPVVFVEHGLELEADVIAGQKTGYFLDQRDNRSLLRSYAGGARVLDVFACSGGFSLAAAAGGARTVTSTDLSEAALATARRNFAHNAAHPRVAACRHHTLAGDAFEVLADLGRGRRRFDVVVVDPPSFAAPASAVTGALRAYGRLTKLALAVLEPGGLLVQSSCSSRVTADAFHQTVEDAARRAGVTLWPLHRTAQPLDHPITFAEGAYLKTLFARRR